MPLVAAVNARLAAGEQSLLFLNRRGYAPLTICRACGHQVGCDACDARMVEHRFRKRLVCHQCGATRPIPNECPACKVEGRMTALGPGVERLAEEAVALWPEARIAILSSDLAEGPRALKARIEEIAGGGADIVIGTQIVSKGHNFPLLTLVGVIDADLGLQGGDLRAAEKTFQLIRQVAGRAGRAERPGLALVQTHQPEHPAMRAILTGDDEGFWRAEAEARRRAVMPPYGRLAGVVVSGTDEPRTWEVARALARGQAPLAAVGAELFGPAPAPVARVRGRHRVRLLVRAAKGVALQPALGRGWRRCRVRGTCGWRWTSIRRASSEARAAPAARPARPPARAGRCPPRQGERPMDAGALVVLQSRLGTEGEGAMSGKPTDDLERRIAQARGDAPADLVLRGGRVFDLVTGSMIDGDVAICGERIAGIGADYDGAEVDRRRGSGAGAGVHRHASARREQPRHAARVRPLRDAAGGDDGDLRSARDRQRPRGRGHPLVPAGVAAAR